MGGEGGYTKNICGQKVFSIVSVNPPACLEIGSDGYTIDDTHRIRYKDWLALPSEVDITHTIKYKVLLNEYINIAPNLTGSFTFKILCPATVVSSTLKKPTNFSNDYDVANPGKIKIDAPLIELEPKRCFNVTGYEIHVKD